MASYKVLGVISVTAGTPVDLATAFSSFLDPSKRSSMVNTLLFQAHEGNGVADIYIGDRTMAGGNDNTRGTVLSTRQYIAMTSGTNANCVDPRDYRVDASAGTLKVRVSILKV